ncbi:hypothetical protein D3C72_1357880 [compost metagenome]
MHRDQVRHAATLRVRAAHGVTRSLGSDHPHVEVGARLHETVVHVEAVREDERSAFLDVRGHVVLVDGGDLLVGQQDHDDVGRLHGISDFSDLQASLADLVPRSAALAQADHDLDAAVVQVLRMCVTLRAVADDGNRLALDQAEVRVLVVINLHDVLQIDKRVAVCCCAVRPEPVEGLNAVPARAEASTSSARTGSD